MRSVDEMIKGVVDLENMRYKVTKLIIAEKMKSMLELAKNDEKIPYNLEFTEEELELVEDMLADKALEENRGDTKSKKIYAAKEIDEVEESGTLVKIDGILLCLGKNGKGTYYYTMEDYMNFLSEEKDSNISLNELLYFKVDSLKKEEFFKLFGKEKGEKDKNLEGKNKITRTEDEDKIV